ncbi:hypothetical protein LCGC14_2807870 [marine sediment metagenome]|uniref:Uncharacterized protein n=1 Tax=marine sediment metagenome TaxID=412755 RepID=A0A0F9AU92_9ZZZZ
MNAETSGSVGGAGPTSGISGVSPVTDQSPNGRGRGGGKGRVRPRKQKRKPRPSELPPPADVDLNDQPADDQEHAGDGHQVDHLA